MKTNSINTVLSAMLALVFGSAVGIAHAEGNYDAQREMRAEDASNMDVIPGHDDYDAFNLDMGNDGQAVMPDDDANYGYPHDEGMLSDEEQLDSEVDGKVDKDGKQLPAGS